MPVRRTLACALAFAAMGVPPRAAAAGAAVPAAFGLDAGQQEAVRAGVERAKGLSGVPAGAGADGAIVAAKPYEFPPFETSGFLQKEDIRSYYETVIRRKYEDAARTTAIQSISYLSDGLRIEGLVLRPRDVPAGTRLPLLVFNHGGNRDFGAIDVKDVAWLAKFAGKGYIVLASQYRGCGGSAGSDEFGGRDVDDVLNLVKAGKSLPDADPGRVFMMGHSRGGMETYLALRAAPEIRAAAVMAGECDLKAGLASRPEMETDVYREIIPGYAENRERSLRERSACSWPERIRTPVYILQGVDDQAVDPAQAAELAGKLEAAGVPHKLEMFPGSHNLWFFDQNADAVAGKIDAWFRAH